VLVIPIVESVTGGKNIQALLQVSGVELVFIGPADYSSTRVFAVNGKDRASRRNFWRSRIRACARQALRRCDDEPGELIERRLQGFRMLGFGTDSGLFLRGCVRRLARWGETGQCP